METGCAVIDLHEHEWQSSLKQKTLYKNQRFHLKCLQNLWCPVSHRSWRPRSDPLVSVVKLGESAGSSVVQGVGGIKNERKQASFALTPRHCVCKRVPTQPNAHTIIHASRRHLHVHLHAQADKKTFPHHKVIPIKKIFFFLIKLSA